MLGFRAGSGGVGRVMTTLIGGILDRGFGVDLLLPPGEHPDLAALGARIGRFDLDARDADAAGRQVRRYLAAERPSALLSNKDQTHALLRRADLGQLRPRTVFRVGTNVIEKLRRQNPLTAPWRQRSLGRLLAEADGLIGISPGVSAALERVLPPARAGVPRPTISTIWNPVDAAALYQAAAEPVAHPWLSAPEMPVIVSVGRLVKAKDYPTLLRAFSRLRAMAPCRLILIGEGRQRAALGRLAVRLGITDALDMVGHLPNPFPLVAAADLFVVSSRFEGANNALMEAVALGTPCVAVDCPSGPAEILRHGELGPVVPAGNARALAAAMAEALAPKGADHAALRASAARFDPACSVSAYLTALGLPAHADAG
jgi:glycosyltransferase involved in cell wall biosynthesis